LTLTNVLEEKLKTICARITEMTRSGHFSKHKEIVWGPRQ